MEVPARKPEELKRESECPARHQGQCAIINDELGWKHGCPLSDCDKCWAAGGPKSDASPPIRAEITRRYITAVKKNLMSGAISRETFETLLRRHCTPEEAAAARAHPELGWVLDRGKLWEKVKGSWDKADSFMRSLKSRGLANTHVDLTVKGVRRASCFGVNPEGRKVAEPCPSATPSAQWEGKHFCNACGCGDKEIALLDADDYPKIDYPYLECPRGRAGFSNSLLPLVIPPPLPSENALKLDADICGIGDLVYLFWLAEGYRKTGGEVVFYSRKDFFQSMIKMAGFDYVTDNKGVWPGGAHLPTYWHEHHEGMGREGRLKFWSKIFPHNPAPAQPKITPTPEALAWAQDYKKQASPSRPLVVCFPLSIYTARNWSKASWLDLCYRLEDMGYSTVTCVGKGQDKEVQGVPEYPRHFVGLEPEKMVALIAVADLVIAVSSGPSVIAGTLGVKTLVLSGPTTNCYDLMPSVRDFAVPASRCGCVGCSFNGDMGFSNICDHGCRAMAAITVQDILREVDVIMADESITAQTGRIQMNEAKIHPHVPEEQAELFTAVDSSSTENEYLELLAALVRVLKPERVLELGSYKGRGSLTLARALKKNGRGRLDCVDSDPNLCHKLTHNLAAYGLGEITTVWAKKAEDFIPLVSLDPYDFVFLDTYLENRGEELRGLVVAGLLKQGSVVAIHDTSRVRTTREGKPDERTALFYGSMQDLWSEFEGFEFPLSRGMLLLRYKGV